MWRSLAFKWTVTLLLTSLIGVILVGIFAYRTTVTEFDRLLTDQAVETYTAIVTNYYNSHETWDGLEAWLNYENRSNDRSQRRRLPPFALVNTDGVVVADHPPLEMDQRLPERVLSKGTPIIVDGERVGTAILAQPPQLDPREQRYVESTNRALLIGAIGSSTTALIVGLLLSRQFLAPLADLTRAITAMHSGVLDQHVEIRSEDELGTLAQTFNEMSAKLARANQLRQQMTADIAHDLRTPLTVIGGYLEALQDGTLKPTPERFRVMYEEVTLLQRLVEDLRTLSLADAGELPLVPTETAPGNLLERVQDSFQGTAAAANVTLSVDAPPNLPLVRVDEERLVQVLGNLVANALRHTPTGGSITLGAAHDAAGVRLRVQDTGEGIPPEELSRIFERFYRGDPARHTGGGASGLGLAIARSIVEAHGGTLEASSTVGEGTTMTIRLSPHTA